MNYRERFERNPHMAGASQCLSLKEHQWPCGRCLQGRPKVPRRAGFSLTSRRVAHPVNIKLDENLPERLVSDSRHWAWRRSCGL